MDPSQVHQAAGTDGVFRVDGVKGLRSPLFTNVAGTAADMNKRGGMVAGDGGGHGGLAGGAVGGAPDDGAAGQGDGGSAVGRRAGKEGDAAEIKDVGEQSHGGVGRTVLLPLEIAEPPCES